MRIEPTSGAPAWRRRHPVPWAAVVLAALTCVPAAGSQVYRCEGPEGAIEFRQEPCPPGSRGEAVAIDDGYTGWTPTQVDQGAARQGAKTPRHKAPAKRRSAGPSARERREMECRKKREQVEDIDRRLRLGTKAHRGVDLRHRRERLEDFLREQCD
jgi:hypothetical protein